MFSITETSLFKCVATILASALGGGIIYLSNAAEGSHTHIVKVIEPKQDETRAHSEIMDGRSYEDLETVKISYKRLIDGDPTYNGGNYVLYYGSEACPHCTGFLFGNQSISNGSLSLQIDKMSHGVFMKGYEYSKVRDTLKNLNLKFLMVEDIPPTSVLDDSKWTLPWSMNEQGKYIRHDKSAKDFRKLLDAAIEKFGREKAAATPTVILYGKGKDPAIFNRDNLPGLELEKQGEDLSNEIAFKKYLEHYYTKIKEKS